MAKVIGGFKCPYTGRIYHVGDEYDGDYPEEMRSKGYIDEAPEETKEEIKENTEPEKPKKPKKSKE